MNKHRLAICILAILIMVTFISCSNKPKESISLRTDKLTVNPLGDALPGGSFKKLDIGFDKNKLPREAMVYRVKKPNLITKEIQDKARRLGVEGKVIDIDDAIIIRGKEADFVIDKSTGSESYLTMEFKGERKSEGVKNLLKDEEYISLAEKFLMDYGFKRDSMKVKGVNKGSTIVTIDNSGKETKSIVMIGVIFESSPVDGIKYTGVGPKASVWFGDNGKIIGYDSLWRETENFGYYKLLSIEEAIDNVKKGKPLIDGLSNSDEEGVIDTAELVLWSDPAGYNQEYVIPHYLLKGKSKSGSDFTIITRALSDEYIEEKDYFSNTKLPIPEMTTKPQ